MRKHDHNFRNATPGHAAGRFFTIEQANQALVLVRKIVADIVHEYTILQDLHETVDVAQRSGRYEAGAQARDQMVQAVERLQGFVAELDQVGVDLKDWTLGVVHFPCVADGREVVLCWEAGEEEVAFWHEVDSEFSDRKSIATLPCGEAVLAVKN